MKRTQRNKIDQISSAEKTSRIIKDKFMNKPYPNIQARTENQSHFLQAMRKYTIVVGQGSSGVGKTLLACWWAGKNLADGSIKRIVLLRAYQPLANRTAGLVPGSAKEKLMPHYIQMVEYLKDFLGSSVVEAQMDMNNVEISSLETIRGRNWEDCIVILDESQNLTPQEVQAVTTRIGDNCQVIMCGDPVQHDCRKQDGLTYLNKICSKYDIQDCSFTTFTPDDIQRSGVVREFVLAYDQETNS